MPYVLVILRGGRNAENEHLHTAAHTEFISSLIERNLVLLGGAFGEPIDDAYAAYVLRCGSVAADDPFVLHEVVRPRCVEWELVGINPDAIDASAIVRPDDV